MTIRGIIVPVISTVAFAASCLAAEQFRIPNERAKALIGAWSVVMMGEGDEGEIVPAERAMALIFRPDGSGVQRKGMREKPIIWGGDNKGAFSFQWKQDDGNGDGVMGQWKATKEGMRLTLREYEDGKAPEGDQVVLILKREKKQPATREVPSKLEEIWKENSAFLEDSMRRIDAGVADSKKLLLDPTTPANMKESAVSTIERAFLYFPDSTKELVPGLAKMLGDKEVSRNTKKSIMKIFARMGTKAESATGDVVDYIKNNLPPDSEERVFAVMTLGDLAPENEFYLQEATKLLDHESSGLRGRIALKLLQAGVKNEKVVSIVKQGIGGRLEIPGMFTVARASGSLTEDEKKAFAEAAGKYAGSYKNYKSNIAYYCIYKLKGDMPKAMEAYERSLNEKGPLVMASWHEMPFLSDSEISQLAPVIVEKMKENRNSPRISSFSFRLSELIKDE